MKTKRKNFWKYLVGGASLTTFMFIFQACYGTPQDMHPDVLIQGQVTSSQDGSAIPDIKIKFDDDNQYAMTDSNGNFAFYTYERDAYNLIFEDIDSTNNGAYLSKDTSIVSDEYEINLNIALDEVER